MDIATPYIDAQALLCFYAGYRKPREKIRRMVQSGELIRLKNGHYLMRDKIQEGIPFEQVANWLYGPSYVSLEWALSFYGFIPERVYTVTSMTLGRAKEFHTPVGNFSYRTLPSASYAVGITHKEQSGFVGNFLIATPEKALADVVAISCKGLTKSELRTELLESKRIDPRIFQELDKELLEEIQESYRSRSVALFVDLVGTL